MPRSPGPGAEKKRTPLPRSIQSSLFTQVWAHHKGRASHVATIAHSDESMGGFARVFRRPTRVVPRGCDTQWSGTGCWDQDMGPPIKTSGVRAWFAFAGLTGISQSAASFRIWVPLGELDAPAFLMLQLPSNHNYSSAR